MGSGNPIQNRRDFLSEASIRPLKGRCIESYLTTLLGSVEAFSIRNLCDGRLRNTQQTHPEKCERNPKPAMHCMPHGPFLIGSVG
ncbi:hypothetical protein [Rhodothermus marinus]|uniref:hypothetical protein n=1 Tax=Rhodothermus marinus TaxID=29549 RepID=UPI001FB3EF15|nr:hypothetical protein [Rhodothermus marinus]